MNYTTFDRSQKYVRCYENDNSNNNNHNNNNNKIPQKFKYCLFSKHLSLLLLWPT